MFKRIKEYKTLLHKVKNAIDIKYDDDKRVIVKINIRDDSSVLSPYSSFDAPVISNEFAEFIEHNVKHLKPKTKIHFVVNETVEEKKKEVYQQAIKNYYGSEFVELSYELNRNKWFAIIMTLIGAFFFALALFLQYYSNNEIITNIIDVVAWVFVWEAVDLYLLQRTLMRIKRHRCFELMNCKLS